jgi:two-component sensor histidine kinase
MLLSGRKRHPSIRFALVLVVFLAMAPALGIIILSGIEYSAALSDRARADSSRQVEAFAQIQERITEATRQVLATLTALPGFRSGQYDHVSAILRSVHARSPDYLNFTAVDTHGTVVASSMLPLGINLADRFHYRDALDRNSFAAGKYLINMIDATPAIAYAHPFEGADGSAIGALAVIIKLDRYDALFEDMELPQDSILGLLDADGRRLYFYPAKESNPVGSPIKQSMWNAISSGGDSGTFIEKGSDQVERYYSYRKLRLEPSLQPYMYIVYGAPVESTDGRSRMVMARNVLLMLAVMVFGLSSAGLLSRTLFGKRLDRILSTAAGLREGNLAARTGIGGDYSDLGQIATAIDQMASTIEHRDHERMEHSKALAASLEEKEVLLREVHHRVKNNLQLIQSLLVLQSESPDDIQAFEERMSSRLRAMSMVHQMLYESENLHAVNLGEYARRLVELMGSSFQGSAAVDVVMDFGGVPSDIDTAIPFGLMLNELVTNAWKHAFAGGRGGSLRVSLALHDGSVMLEVGDDGPGLPPGFSISEASSLGLRLAQALSSQLGGTLTFESGGSGTTFKAVFPADRSARS